MSSVQHLREFIGARLTAAAEEIFTEFEKTIVQYEEELDRQRRLLDISWKPHIQLHRIEVLQQHVHKEEDVLCDQEEYPQFILEQEDVCPSLEGRWVDVKQETDNVTLVSTLQECDFQEAEPNTEQLSPLPEIHDQEVNRSTPLETTRETETKPEEKRRRNRKRRNDEENKNILQYKEEIHRQRRMLDVRWRAHLNATELQHEFVSKGVETSAEEQLLDQEENPNEVQEEPEPSETEVDDDEKEEEEEEGEEEEEEEEEEVVCTNQEGEQLVRKQEAEVVMVTPTSQEGDQSESKPDIIELFSQNSSSAQVQNQEGSSSGDPQSRPKTFICSFCGKGFKQRHNMVRHVRCHTGENPFICKICGEGFMKRSTLEAHMKVHVHKKLYSCDNCGKSFAYRSSLKTHVMLHVGQTPHTCETCGKSFDKKSTLKIHTMVHKTKKKKKPVKKPFTCLTCGRSYMQPIGLKTHMRIHSGENLHHCDMCGRTCTSRSVLLVHMRIHTGERPFSCDTCQKKFISRKQLFSHLKIHTGEFPTCKDCGRHFKNEADLQRHMKTHIPFHCITCNKNFRTHSNWMKHMRLFAHKGTV